MLNKIVIGACLTALFVGVAQELRITARQTRYDHCLREVQAAEWQCRKTGKYPNAIAGPVNVIDPCETYALQDKGRCAAVGSTR